MPYKSLIPYRFGFYFYDYNSTVFKAECLNSNERITADAKEFFSSSCFRLGDQKKFLRLSLARQGFLKFLTTSDHLKP